MEEYKNMWKNYFNFSDRTSVRGYWMAVLFNVGVVFVLNIISAVTGLSLVYAILGIYGIAAFIPGIAMAIRRLRDAGKSPVLLLLTLIPLIGGIIVLVMLCGSSIPDDGVPQV